MKTFIQLLTLSAILISFTHASFADEAFRKRHPRRAEVNARERNQGRRIRQGVRNGTISSQEATADRQNLRDIKKTERAEVKANGGHLTKDETKELNQELNQNSKQIEQEKKN